MENAKKAQKINNVQNFYSRGEGLPLVVTVQITNHYKTEDLYQISWVNKFSSQESLQIVVQVYTMRNQTKGRIL